MSQSIFSVSARARVLSYLCALALLVPLLLAPGARFGPVQLPGARDARADAGDQYWDGMGANAVNDVVMSMTIFQGELIVGGFFTQAGSTPMGHIAAFDGQNWHALGSGMDGVGVYSLTVYQGNLVAGGWFDTAGGVPASNIASWDGTSWTPIGAGTDGVVWSLSVHDGDLMAGGLFLNAGGVPAKVIAQWDGSSWSPLGGGLVPQEGYAFGIFSLEDFGGDLIAGGAFAKADGIVTPNIARWDGTHWHSMAGGTNGIVYAQTLRSGVLDVGGAFSLVGGHAASRIAGWNGTSWSALGSGVSGGDFAVDALAPVDSELILGGVFTSAGGHPASRIASWDGSAYGPLGSGANDAVRAFCLFNQQLYVGGSFDSIGTQFSPHLARWNSPETSGVAWGNSGSGPCPDCGPPVPAGSLNPAALRLAQAFPNPFRSSTQLQFSRPATSPIEVDVYDLFGRHLAALRQGRVGTAMLAADWDGRDDLGRPVPPGLYFARLRGDGASAPLKLVRTK